ncbi:MAG: hypothetical protein KGS00_06350 [Alphaproteobacteria bacterium]|nr:hypothetical protein [Alphaproteobacteria bacterium]
MARILSPGVIIGLGAGAAAVVAGIALIGGPSADRPGGATGPVSSPPSEAGSGAAPTGEDSLIQPAQANAPLAPGAADISFEDETLVFRADFPAGAGNDLILRSLRDEAQDYLDRMKSSARTEFERAAREGDVSRPWSVSVAWRVTARGGGLISLAGQAIEDTGGAHPSLAFDARTGRSATGEKIGIEDMLIPERSPSPALVIAVCEALKAEKSRTIGSATIFDEPIVCAGSSANLSLEDAQISLASSDQEGRFGGLHVEFPPYAVGSWAEGPYRLIIQQSVFADDLRAEYRALFSGTAPAR